MTIGTVVGNNIVQGIHIQCKLTVFIYFLNKYFGTG